MLLLLFAASVWSPDALMSLQTIHDPQLSSDGKQVAYVVRQVDTAANRYLSTIWLLTRGKSPQPMPASHPTDASPRWSPDGRQLAFLSRRSGNLQIHLSSGRQLTQSTTGIQFFRWSRDGRQIAYVAPRPLSAEEQQDRAAGRDMIIAGKNYRDSAIVVLTLATGATQTLHIPKHVLSFDWSPDGSKIAYAAQKNGRAQQRFHADLFEYSLAKGTDTPLVVQPGQDLYPVYSNDGKYIAFHSQVGSLSYFGPRQLGVVPSGGGPIRYLTQTLDGDVFSGGSKIWWSPDDKEIRFGAGKGSSDYLYSVDVANALGKRLGHSDTNSFSISADGQHTALLRDSALYLDQKLLVDLKPQGMPAFQTETVRWKSKDGLEIEGVLRYPVNYATGKKVPLLVLVHGGPTGVATESFPVPRMYPTQAFLQEGFATFEPNFRGSINYGPAFRTATIQRQGYGDMDDIMTGVDHLIAKGIADPNRLGIMGWSYGGFLSSWIITQTNRFQAASLGGCSMDWVTYYGMSVGGDDGPPEVIHEYFGGKPWDRLEAYYRHSQRPHLKNIKTPTLLMRGERDLDNVAELYLALTESKIPTEFITYPREPHSIGEPAHQRDMMTRNLDWFKRWLRP
ncbi:alpha/beta hydrolase family protein [Bryobacter aggregatus]|uniref:S9 family peptidase n=1 Tax=Bryobacter aggregatus TaxID=360054 RepID=UPI0004E271FB|nr:S9 family peptidase [Bryobacter aggregatus]